MNGVILPAMTYGSETWSLTNKQRERLAVAQRNMERSMLGITKKGKKRNEWIGIGDIMEKIDVMKWSWAGHKGRMKNDRWAKKCTKWIPGRKRKRGRPTRRWRDDIEKVAAVNWISKTENRRTWMLERPSASSGLNG